MAGSSSGVELLAIPAGFLFIAALVGALFLMI
jgi:hypothetical protein